MKVRALRGVCIGVERHLAAGDVAEIDAPAFPFLSNIGAVELFIDAPVADNPETVKPAVPVKEKK